MSKIREIPWPRILAEGTAIVVSILLAFWIQAWWEGRQLEIQEQELLAQIRVEFEANKTIFKDYRQLHSEIIAAATRLLNRTSPDASAANGQNHAFMEDLHIVSDYWTVNPSIGVVSSLIQSGQLSIIRSHSIRSELAAWPAKLQDLHDEESIVQRYTVGVFYEYWFANASYRDVFPAEEVGPSNFSFDVEKILRDRRFENLLHERLLGEKGVLDDYGVAEAAIEKVLLMTAESLNK